MSSQCRYNIGGHSEENAEVYLVPNEEKQRGLWRNDDLNVVIVHFLQGLDFPLITIPFQKY